MELTLKDLKYLEQLSALNSTDEELLDMVDSFNDIAKFVDKVKNADISQVETLGKIITLDELRSDEVKPSLSVSKVLLNAPEKENGAFVMPKVVE